MSTEVDLTIFRNATQLYWQQHTVFEAGRGVDGTLVADGESRLPLDIYSPEEMTRGVTPPLSNGVGVVEYKPVAISDMRAAVRGWCRDQLGRDDVEFGE